MKFIKSEAWTPEEIARLRREWPKQGLKCASLFPGRSAHAVKHKAGKLSLIVTKHVKYERTGLSWSQVDLDYLAWNYRVLGPTKCSVQLQRSPDTIKKMAQKLNLTMEIKEGEDEWAIAPPEQRVVKKWKPAPVRGPRWVFDLAGSMV